MKIAMLTTVGERCGIAAYSAKLIDALRAQPRVTVQVVPIKVGRQPKEYYIEESAQYVGADVDVVHIQHEHSFWGGILPKTSAYWEMRYLIKKPIVLTAHTTYSLAEMLRLKEERRPHKWIAKKLLTLNKTYRDSVDIAPFITAYTIVHTAEARDQLVRRGANPNNLTVLPSGIPEPLPAPTNGDAFRKLHGLENSRVLSIFGYIAPNKGYEQTLDVLAKLPEDVVLTIAGGERTEDMTPYRAQLESRIAQAGLSSRVRITGYLSDEDIAEAMAASDLVLVPHTQATGSYSVTIPLSYGKPLLGSDLACFREIAERGSCIELFPVGDRDAYRERVATLLADPARRAQLSAKALEYAQATSWNKIAARTVGVYKEAIKAYGGRVRKDFIPLDTIQTRLKR